MVSLLCITLLFFPLALGQTLQDPPRDSQVIENSIEDNQCFQCLKEDHYYCSSGEKTRCCSPTDTSSFCQNKDACISPYKFDAQTSLQTYSYEQRHARNSTYDYYLNLFKCADVMPNKCIPQQFMVPLVERYRSYKIYNSTSDYCFWSPFIIYDNKSWNATEEGKDRFVKVQTKLGNNSEDYFMYVWYSVTPETNQTLDENGNVNEAGLEGIVGSFRLNETSEYKQDGFNLVQNISLYMVLVRDSRISSSLEIDQSHANVYLSIFESFEEVRQEQAVSASIVLISVATGLVLSGFCACAVVYFVCTWCRDRKKGQEVKHVDEEEEGNEEYFRNEHLKQEYLEFRKMRLRGQTVLHTNESHTNNILNNNNNNYQQFECLDQDDGSEFKNHLHREQSKIEENLEALVGLDQNNEGERAASVYSKSNSRNTQILDRSGTGSQKNRSVLNQSTNKSIQEERKLPAQMSQDYQVKSTLVAQDEDNYIFQKDQPKSGRYQANPTERSNYIAASQRNVHRVDEDDFEEENDNDEDEIHYREGGASQRRMTDGTARHAQQNTRRSMGAARRIFSKQREEDDNEEEEDYEEGEDEVAYASNNKLMLGSPERNRDLKVNNMMVPEDEKEDDYREEEDGRKIQEIEKQSSKGEEEVVGPVTKEVFYEDQKVSDEDDEEEEEEKEP